MIVGVYVDDIISAGKSKKLVDDLKRVLGKRFDTQDLGKLHGRCVDRSTSLH